MNKLSSKELDLYSNQILEDYDAKKPSQIFKNKVIKFDDFKIAKKIFNK